MVLEDFDFCYRAQKHGLKVWYQPTSVVLHHHRATSNQNISHLNYLLYRNFAINYLINTPIRLYTTRISFLKFILVYVNTLLWLTFNQKCFNAAVSVQVWILINIISLIKLRKHRNTQIVSNEYLDAWREDKKLKIVKISF